MAEQKDTMLDDTANKSDLMNINSEMRTSFVDYAMSVIVSRALPDVRDGLKPVQRRIIYAMNDMGVRSSGPHRKSATVVGEVIGKYHPHSNDAIYEALVRMGQSFSLRYPLIHPQGNFGSTDDPPAAMRYTECRLDELADVMLDGIKEDTVDFIDNFDGSESEPTVLPSRFPNLLVNGSQGIAVGMATNIPPYNLAEVFEACLYGLENPDAAPEDYLPIISGPDFPTGGLIVGSKGVRDALLTGRGSVKMRAVTTLKKLPRGRSAIVVTELPYQISQDQVMEKIANLVQQKTVTSISDLRNESSAKVGIRLVIELKRDTKPQIVLNQLYKYTGLQKAFGVNTVALVDGVPRVLNIAEMIKHFLVHQTEVVERRTRFRLERAKARLHIIEGLLIAVDNIDAVIAIIRSSPDSAAARATLKQKYPLSDIQARAILDMPLRRITSLETDQLRDERKELIGIISELEAILNDPAVLRNLIKDELQAVKDQHSDKRKTRIVKGESELVLEDLIANEKLMVSVSADGYVKTVTSAVYERKGGKKAFTTAREGDYLTHVIPTHSHAFLLFFSTTGRVHRIRGCDLPIQPKSGVGVPVQSILPFDPDERIRAVAEIRDYSKNKFVVMVTRNGFVKRSTLSEYDSSLTTLKAVNLVDGDELIEVYVTEGDRDIMLFTRLGQSIRFPESDVRPIGRVAKGVKGIKLRAGDSLAAAAVVSDAASEDVLLVTSGGYAKRTLLSNFPIKRRAGVGVQAYKLTRVRGEIVSVVPVSLDDKVLIVSDAGSAKVVPARSVGRQQRATTGSRVIDIPKGGKVAACTIVVGKVG